jgi:hypothetical protein
MPVLNSKKREIDIKIVYYGPALCGKTTNLQSVFKKLAPHQRGEMVSLSTKDDRTLFFDFLPIELGNVKGYKTRFHVYTVPGQVYYGLTRRAVLTNFDGVIFIADSQAGKMEENIESFNDLEENLRFYKKDIYSIPFVLQYNKRDLPNIISIEELYATLNKLQSPYFEASAIKGPGVMETLTACCKQVLRQFDEASAKNDTPAIKLYKETETSSPYIPLEITVPTHQTSKEDLTKHRQFSSVFSESPIETPAMHSCATTETDQHEKTEMIEESEISKRHKSIYVNARSDGYSAEASQAQNVSTAGSIYKGFTEPCMEKGSDGCVPRGPLSSPLTEGTDPVQGPVIRITSAPAEPVTAELPFYESINKPIVRPEGAAVTGVAELSELPPCPVARISLENIEEDAEIEVASEGFAEENQPQTLTLEPEDSSDLAEYYSAAVTKDKIISEQLVAVSAVADIEDTATFKIVACGQPHRESATAVIIPLIFKIEELNKECLINLIINFNDFTIREPRQ